MDSLQSRPASSDHRHSYHTGRRWRSRSRSRHGSERPSSYSASRERCSPPLTPCSTGPARDRFLVKKGCTEYSHWYKWVLNDTETRHPIYETAEEIQSISGQLRKKWENGIYEPVDPRKPATLDTSTQPSASIHPAKLKRVYYDYDVATGAAFGVLPPPIHLIVHHLPSFTTNTSLTHKIISVFEGAAMNAQPFTVAQIQKMDYLRDKATGYCSGTGQLVLKDWRWSEKLWKHTNGFAVFAAKATPGLGQGEWQHISVDYDRDGKMYAKCQAEHYQNKKDDAKSDAAKKPAKDELKGEDRERSHRDGASDRKHRHRQDSHHSRERERRHRHPSRWDETSLYPQRPQSRYARFLECITKEIKSQLLRAIHNHVSKKAVFDYVASVEISDPWTADLHSMETSMDGAHGLLLPRVMAYQFTQWQKETKIQKRIREQSLSDSVSIASKKDIDTHAALPPPKRPFHEKRHDQLTSLLDAINEPPMIMQSKPVSSDLEADPDFELYDRESLFDASTEDGADSRQGDFDETDSQQTDVDIVPELFTPKAKKKAEKKAAAKHRPRADVDVAAEPIREIKKKETQAVKVAEFPALASGAIRLESYISYRKLKKTAKFPSIERGEDEPQGIVATHHHQPQATKAMRQKRASQRSLADVPNSTSFHKTRLQKSLVVAKSAIHAYGLFSRGPIPPGSFVIEYVGEQISNRVATQREHFYESTGLGSSYFFRCDSYTVIDATKFGNASRFINHSCEPNCIAKVLSFNPSNNTTTDANTSESIVAGNSSGADTLKKIYIYAKKFIDIGDEITYDYKFPLEKVKIPCYCGALKCRKYLN